MVGLKYFPQQSGYKPALKSALDLCIGSLLSEPFCLLSGEKVTQRPYSAQDSSFPENH